MGIYALVRRGRAVFALMMQHWRLGAGGGVMQVDILRHRDLGDDGRAHCARGSLARDQRLFGTILAVVFLKEALLMPRVAAALLIVAGW